MDRDEVSERAATNEPPHSLRELFVDVAVLKSQMNDVRRFQWWIFTTVAGGFISIFIALALAFLTGRTG